jgi:hypothetical protein
LYSYFEKEHDNSLNDQKNYINEPNENCNVVEDNKSSKYPENEYQEIIEEEMDDEEDQIHKAIHKGTGKKQFDFGISTNNENEQFNVPMSTKHSMGKKMFDNNLNLDICNNDMDLVLSDPTDINEIFKGQSQANETFHTKGKKSKFKPPPNFSLEIDQP